MNKEGSQSVTNKIYTKDLIVGNYYKNIHGVIFKVEELTWHTEGMHKGKVKDLIFVKKDGSRKNYSFLPYDAETIFIDIVNGYEFDVLEIENQRFREALENIINVELERVPKYEAVEMKRIARKALEGDKP